MHALHAVGHALGVAGSMAWQITWSLILGFTLTGIVCRQTITRLLGDDRPKTLAIAAHRRGRVPLADPDPSGPDHQEAL